MSPLQYFGNRSQSCACPQRWFRWIVASALAIVAQVGPAIACAVFDGPGKPGCPLFFLESSRVPTYPDRDPTPDCSTGPAFVAPDLQSVEMLAPPENRTSDTFTAIVYFDSTFGVTRSRDDALIAVLSPYLADQGRHLYLVTSRLRI